MAATLNFESANGTGGVCSADTQLLRDIEEISNSLSLRRQLVKNPSSNHKPESTQRTHILASNSNPSSRFLDSSDDDERLIRQKKSSVWSWKPLKALSHIWQKKFHCSFFCHVHCIQNLPLGFDGLKMSVLWKRKDNVSKTRHSRVSNGAVEFEETLVDRCLVYCSRNGAGNFVKYEPKHFLLSASLVGAPAVDLGSHWVDLTRLLPLTFEDLEKDNRPGKSTTTFKLGGKAKGATLHVSFDFLVMTANMVELDCGGRVKSPLTRTSKREHDGVGVLNRFASSGCEPGDKGMLRRLGSVPSSLHHGRSHSSYCLDVKTVHQISPNRGFQFSDSVGLLYEKFEQGNLGASEKSAFDFKNSESLNTMPSSYSKDGKCFSGYDYDCSDVEFTVIEKGIELDLPKEEQLKSEESIAAKSNDSLMEVVDVSEILKDVDGLSQEEIRPGLENGDSGVPSNDAAPDMITGASVNAALDMDTSMCEMDFVKEDPDIVLSRLLLSDTTESEPFEVKNRFLEKETNKVTVSKPNKPVESLSLDAMTKAIADDFLKLLGENASPSASSPSSTCESPRERLLREFEQDMLTSGNIMFHSVEDEAEAEMSFLASSFSCSELATEDSACPTPTYANKEDISRNKSKKNRNRPKSLECLETLSLMQRWGLDEDTFKSDSQYSTGGFGSPIYLPPEELGLPSLGEGLGPLLHLKHGGFLRSMNQSLFCGSNNGGRLIIQASRPIVLPTRMGFNVVELLQCFGSIGFESMSKKVSDLMPLEEISGKSVQQLLLEASSSVAEPEKSDYSKQKVNMNFETCEASADDGLSSSMRCEGSEPIYLAIENLVPLLMDRLESLSIEGLKVQSGMGCLAAPSSINLRKGCLPVVDVGAQLSVAANATENDGESLIDLSVSLDEWLRLDSGIFLYKDQTSEHMFRLLAAHSANLQRIEVEELVRGHDAENWSLRCGLLVDNPVVAFMIQLRDPFRNFEPVGAPMLSLIEVERKFDHPSPGISSEKSTEIVSTEEGVGERGIRDRKGISKFMMKQAHLAGLITELDGLELWATRRQKQAGARWLLANNMNKTNMLHLSKSNAITRFSPLMRKQQFTNTLWSISNKSEGSGDQWEMLSTQSGCVRNPDILFS